MHEEMVQLSDNDKTKIRTLQYAFLQLLTQQKQRMYRHDKDITIAYKGIKTLKASFQESCKERQNEEQITSDKYQKAINNEVYLQKEQLTKTKILLDKIKSLRNQNANLTPKIQEAKQKLTESYRTLYKWNDEKIKSEIERYREKWSYKVTVNFDEIQKDLCL